MPNNDFTQMAEFFKERNLIVPSVFERFADSVVQEPGLSRWSIGVPPEAWPFESISELDGFLPTTGGSFTNFASVGFTLHEPWDDVDDEYGTAVIDLRLVTRGLLMELRISEGHSVLKGGGNSWNWTPESEWMPFWNEAMNDLTAFDSKVGLFAQFDQVSESFNPESGLFFDATRDSYATFSFAGGPETAALSTYVDGPPGLGDLLRDIHGDDSESESGDENEMFDFLESNELDEPPYFADFCQFIEREENGFGWRLAGGPDISTFADYMQESYSTVLENPMSPQLALNHEGHGINSYGLNLRMQVGPVLVVAQYGWGGGYMDVEKQRAAWNDGMESLHDFFDEIDLNVDIFAKPEPREIEVAIRYSEFRGSEAQVRNESGEWSRINLDGCRTFDKVLKRVLKQREDTWGLF